MEREDKTNNNGLGRKGKVANETLRKEEASGRGTEARILED